MFARTMKDLEQYLGENCSDIYQSAIMNAKLATLLDVEIPTIIPDTGVKCPKTDVDMTYPKNKSIDEAIHKKLNNKDI